jgi:hypothetical protein
MRQRVLINQVAPGRLAAMPEVAAYLNCEKRPIQPGGR